MTKLEAIEMLQSKMDGSVDTSYEWCETIRIAIECIQHCINEEGTIYKHICSSCGYTWSDKYEVVSEICPRCDRMMDGSNR